MSSDNLLLSICMITCNHENYLSMAIDSVFKQKMNFKFNVVIGEDFSSDNTAQICMDYKSKHPNLIKLIINSGNMGILRNFIQTLQACKGKYIAICEGDDYWTDPHKLQKQIDFLEANTDYSACAHQATVVYENGEKDPHLFNNLTAEFNFITKDLIGLRKFHTASFVFRAELFHSINNFPTNITSADRALFLLCAASGPIKYFPLPMCVYRKNEQGISGWITTILLKKDLNIIPWIREINPKFPQNRFKSYLFYTIFTYPEKARKSELLKYYFLFAFYSFSYFPHNIRHVLRSLRKDVLAKL